MIELMAITESVRNKRFLICNFMNELRDKYEEAVRRGSSRLFSISDFRTIKLPIFQHDSSFVRDTLIEYQHAREFIKINDDAVNLTSKGLMQLKLGKDWD